MIGRGAIYITGNCTLRGRGVKTPASNLACAVVVCVLAGETILVSFLAGEEGGPSKYTRWLIRLFLLWISELRSILCPGVRKQTTAIRKDHVAKSLYSANDGYE